MHFDDADPLVSLDQLYKRMATQNMCQQDLNGTEPDQGSVRCYSWRRILSLAIEMGTSSCKMSIKIFTDVNLVLLRIWSLILSCIGKGVTGLLIDFAAFQKFLGSE